MLGNELKALRESSVHGKLNYMKNLLKLETKTFG